MKNLILTTAIFTLIYFQGFTQTPNQPVKWEYAIMTISSNFAILDTGDGDRIARDKRIRDEQGNPIRFESPVHALNYLGLYGWELIIVNSSRSGTITSTEYLLKRLKPNE